MKETARKCTSVNQAAGQIVYNLLSPSSEEIGRYMGSIFAALPQFK